MFKLPTNDEKAAVWKAYYERHPTRVPLRWNVNTRIIIQDPELNPDRYEYHDMFYDPVAALRVQSRFQEYVRTTLGRTCDTATELPANWGFGVEGQNVHDGAYFGAKLVFRPGQVPCTEPELTVADVDAFLRRDYSKPLENPWVKDRLKFHTELTAAAKDFTYLDRKGTVGPLGFGFDGAVTAAVTIFGADIFTLFAEDPAKARRLLEFITQACITRHEAMAKLGGYPVKNDWGWAADDSIQLISNRTYTTVVLPVHEQWYRAISNTTPADRKRSIHLCGDSTRHFKTLVDQLGVVSFDTGFPVDHGALRRELGPDVEISGGPHVALLERGTPAQCAARAREILTSDVMTGGRFILQEGNNLPPRVPRQNLEAVYATCLDVGRYGEGRTTKGE